MQCRLWWVEGLRRWSVHFSRLKRGEPARHHYGHDDGHDDGHNDGHDDGHNGGHNGGHNVHDDEEGNCDGGGWVEKFEQIQMKGLDFPKNFILKPH